MKARSVVLAQAKGSRLMADIRTTEIDGETYVLVPEEDFHDLVDGILADRILARIHAGEETWPAHLVDALLITDSRIRTFRQYRGMMVADLAEAAGISRRYLSEIEAGRKTGSVRVLARIAKALRVDLDDLVVEPEVDHQ